MTSNDEITRASEHLATRAVEDPSLLIDRALGHVVDVHGRTVLRDLVSMMLCISTLDAARVSSRPPQEIAAALAHIAHLRVHIPSRENALDQFLSKYEPERSAEAIRAATGQGRVSVPAGDGEPDPTLTSEWVRSLESCLKYYLDMPQARLHS